jgi:16S rRNA (cytosine967-C5)-methyltransferase
MDILAELERRGSPADKTLDGWGKANRYAGSKDRAAIAERVFAVLRRKAEIVHRMHGATTPRALVMGSLLVADQKTVREVHELFSAGNYGPKPLDFEERKALLNPPEPAKDLPTRYNVPAWLLPQLEKAFGDTIEQELAALSMRAPLDIRTNALKSERDDLEDVLAAEHIVAEKTTWSPLGLRITDPSARQATGTEAFTHGKFEVQDDGSQCAALITGAKPGQTVVDLCAGAGGKTLALSAMMENKGKLIACDVEAGSLDELKRRATRAGASLIETRALAKSWMELARGSKLDDLTARADIVLVDAPCSGSGTWRRNPGLKWRLTAAQLNAFKALQLSLLEAAAKLLSPSGRLFYVTCSLLPVENEDVANAFLTQSPTLKPISTLDLWQTNVRPDAPTGVSTTTRLSPASSQTDGFFIAAFEKQ